MTGQPFSSFRTKSRKPRPFRLVKFGLWRERNELFERINQRTETMMGNGLLEEAKRVLPFRRSNALNTVGYKELFKYFDGEWDLSFAVEKIKRNTRVYSKINYGKGCIYVVCDLYLQYPNYSEIICRQNPIAY